MKILGKNVCVIPTYDDPLRDLTSPSMQEHLKIHRGFIIFSRFTKSSHDRVFALLGVLGIMFLMEDVVSRILYAYVTGVCLPQDSHGSHPGHCAKMKAFSI